MKQRNPMTEMLPRFFFAGIVSVGLNPCALADPADDAFREGQALCQQNRKAEAIHAFDKAIKLRGKDVAFLRERGNTYVILGDFKSAAGDCGRIIALDSKNEEAYRNRAWCYLKDKQYAKGIADADKSLK